jgi:hypothetical protein
MTVDGGEVREPKLCGFAQSEAQAKGADEDERFSREYACVFSTSLRAAFGCRDRCLAADVAKVADASYTRRLCSAMASSQNLSSFRFL